MDRARILVIGGGIAGVAAAWHLARGGAREVVLLERERVLGAHSSGRNAAILRTLTERATTTELALETARFLASPPPGFAERALVDPCGLVLVLGDALPPAYAAWRRRKGDAVRELSARELHHLAPGYRGSARNALHVRDEGRIDIALLLDALAAGARRGGVDLRTGARVAQILRSGQRVAGVELEGGARIAADCVLLAAGGWAGALGRSAGSQLALRPTRRHLLVTAPSPAIDPRAPILWSDPDAFYARPESGGMLLCACDESDVHPDACEADETVRAAIAAKSARLLPALASAGAAHFWAGLRTFAPDGELAIGPDPDLAGLYWSAGLAGHGMSCSVAAGRIAASHLLGDAHGDPLARALSPVRFAREASAAQRSTTAP